MNTKDLEVFLAIAETENMQQAAAICNKSPSVMSKSLKRLETLLNVQLFDRVGKQIRLNAAGVRFRSNAVKIVAEAKQTLAACCGLQASDSYRIAAPAILYFRWASVLSKVLRSAQPLAAINFQTSFEQQALAQLMKGAVDLALVTTEIANQIPDDIAKISLGKLSMQIGAGKSHPLVNVAMQTVQHRSSIELPIEEVLKYDFVSPSISPYCGEARGIGCDGWPNEMYSRKLSTVVNDYAVLGQIAKSGTALAYLPDFWLRELGLIQIDVADDKIECHEEILLISYQAELIKLFAEA